MAMEISNPNEILFDEEYVFQLDCLGNNNENVKLVIGNEIYIETEIEMFYYDKVDNSFKSDDGVLFILSDDNKKIIESAFNIANI